MSNDSVLDNLISDFFKKGGKIDRYYLRDVNKSKKSLVYLNGWFSGQNIKAAITKAFEK